jgi:hypothetical protein
MKRLVPSACMRGGILFWLAIKALKAAALRTQNRVTRTSPHASASNTPPVDHAANDVEDNASAPQVLSHRGSKWPPRSVNGAADAGPIAARGVFNSLGSVEVQASGPERGPP